MKKTLLAALMSLSLAASIAAKAQYACEWSATGSMAHGRYEHTTTLLPDGRILAAGGVYNSTSCELYDPASEMWSETAQMSQKRQNHTTNIVIGNPLHPEKKKVLVAGGSPSFGDYYSSCELYDPETEEWCETGSMLTGRERHTATTLSDGKILVVGGYGSFFQISSCELYDPTTGAWKATGDMATARSNHTSTLLPDGKVLVTGGHNLYSNYLASCEIYDPKTKKWTETGAMTNARKDHTATLLSNGKVLVVAGDTSHSSCEIYDQASGTWSRTGSLAHVREEHTATLLQYGQVLVVGGYYYDGDTKYTVPCELYDQVSGTWDDTISIAQGRRLHSATLMTNNKVLVTGGCGSTATLASCEVYSPGAFYSLKYMANENGTLKGQTSQFVAHGASGTTVNAIPNNGCYFSEWSDGTRNNPRTDSNVMSDIDVTAIFELNTYTLNYSAGANGKLQGDTSQSVVHGASGTPVTASPNSGYKFDRWSDGKTTNPRTDNAVVDNISVTANFKQEGIVYVHAGASGDGSSWESAMDDLQGGVAIAAKSTDRKCVWVAAGTYKPNDADPSNLSRSQSFILKNGVAVYGGFVGTETELSQRNIAANSTILSGDIGASGEYDNCEHVVSNNGLDASAVLDGFTITGGNSETDGGGMRNKNSSPTVRNCSFLKNYAADDGAGMHNEKSSPNLVDCAFRENSAEDGGGAVYNCVSSLPTMTRCSFSFNSANCGGGVYNHESSPTLSACVFEDNGANNSTGTPGDDEGYYNDEPIDPLTVGDGDGGGIFNYKAAAVLNDCTFTRNSATDHGGGVCVIASNSSSSPVLSKCSFDQNSAARGGGVYVFDSKPTISGCDFIVNSALISGGGVRNNSAGPTIKDCSFIENRSDMNGGGMHNYSRNSHDYPVIDTCVFTKNAAVRNGGGMGNDFSYPKIAKCSFASNTADGDGGGMYNEHQSHPTMDACLFANNTAKGNGGGMFSGGSSYSDSVNCTFSDNSAATNGGGIYSESSFPVTTNCTFSGNSAVVGGGMYCQKSHPTVVNCLFWGDSANSDAATAEFSFDTMSSFKRCVSNVVQGGVSGGTGIITSNPKLDSKGLQDNGGPTKTIATLAGGSGIDKANSSDAPKTDQRGYCRNGAPDIGSYEFGGVDAGPFTVTFVAGTGGSLQGEAVQTIVGGGSCTIVTAVPSAGYNFTGWNKGFGSTNPLTVTNVTANMTITASFAVQGPTLYSLTVVNGVGSGSFAAGASLTVCANTPMAGQTFAGWTGDIETLAAPTAVKTTLAMPSKDITVTANYSTMFYTLLYQSGAHGKLEGTLSQTVSHGGSGTPVTAVPDDGYRFVSWNDGTTTNPRTDDNVTASLYLTASFANNFTLVYAAGSNGKVIGTLSQTVPLGGSGTAVTATADIGYHFTSWSDGSTANPRTDTNITANLTITAQFAIDTFTLTYGAGTHGGLTGTTTQVVAYGASGTAVSAVPAVGYHFASWSDGSIANPRIDSNVRANLSVTASFASSVYTVMFVATAGGRLEGQTTQTVERSASCSAVTAFSEKGYEFTGWDNGFGVTNPLTVTNVTSGLTITATFAKKPAPEYWVAYGSVFTVNASDLNKASFEKAPKVMVNGGGKAKILGFKKGVTSVNCAWQCKDRPGTYSLLVDGKTLTEEFVIESPNDFDAVLSSDTGVAGDNITLTGSYFGSTCPKVAMEFTDVKGKLKKATCKVLKPYKYADGNGKAGKSVMYVGQESSASGYQPGDSDLTFVVPKGITESTKAMLKLNCNGNIVARPFNATE